MLRPVLVTTLIVIGICSVAHADVYRWLDEHGEPHYSDRWVPGSQLIRSSRPHPTVSEGSDSHAAPAATGSGGAQPGSAGAQKIDADSLNAVKADTARRREQQCKDARDRYEK